MSPSDRGAARGAAGGTWAGADVLTRDGTVARVRPLAAGDEPELVRLHEEVSEDNLRLRFFSANRRPALQYVHHLLELPPGTLCLVATVEGRLVAVATAEATGPQEMEIAFLVADAHHGRGLGSLLLEHLADQARTRGVRRFLADVLMDNVAMHRLFLEAGFQLTERRADGVRQMVIDLTSTPHALDAADAREEESERRSLRPMLHPESVVLLGVRRDGSGVGAAVLRSLIDGGFRGRVDVVHPGGGTVSGIESVPSCTALTEPADLAVIAVPADGVVAALGDVADGGTHAAIVVSSGFRELGDHGAALQHDLTVLARRRSVRLVGPNCLGVVSNSGSSPLNATFAAASPESGGLAVASQSGGVGIVLLDAARAAGLGINCFVSLGNKADVSGNDLLAAWLHDASVAGVALYLESFGNAHKFARLARRFSAAKPLLAVIGGRSEGGQRAGASHTAAAASDAVAIDALLDHTGVVRCDGAADLVSTALLLDEQPLPAGRRLGIITNAGGMGVLAADHAASSGLSVPTFSAALGARLGDALSASAGWSNPVDTGAGSTAAQVADAVQAVVDSGEVDSVLVVLVATKLIDVHEVLVELGRSTGDGSETVPMALVVLGTGSVDPSLVPGFTLMPSHEAAVTALARAAARDEWLRTPRGEAPPVDLGRAHLARITAGGLIAAAPESGAWLGFDQLRELVNPFGVHLSGECVVGADAAVEAAGRQGFPVVLKVSSTDGLHKTEGGFVRVGVTDPAGVRAVVTEWEGRLGGMPDVVVQPLATGVEVAVGLVRDPVVGPLVMVAAGGVDIDLWDDRQFLLAPITEVEAERALRRLRVWPRLVGYRGSSAVDVEALLRLVVAVGTLGQEVPEVAELDLNPVLVSSSGTAVVDARVRLIRGAPYGDAPALS